MIQACFRKADLSALNGNLFDRFDKDWMLISAADPAGGVPNTMTASWGCMGILWNKPVVIGFIRPQRFTFPMACAAERLTFSFLPEAYRAALRYCGARSGREGDKFAAAGLTPVFTETGAPYPAEASLVVVGRKLYEDDLREGCFVEPAMLSFYREKDYHRFFICEIEEVLTRAD